MQDLQLLFCMISLFAGVASITLAVFINISKPKKALKYFIGLDASLFVIQVMVTLNLYIVRTNSSGTFLSVFSDGMDILGTAFSSFFGLFLLNALLGKKLTQIKKAVITAITAFQIAAITVCYLNPGFVVFKHIGQASLIAVITYEALMIIVNYHKIPDKELKRGGRIFALITLAFLPFLMLEYIRPDIDAIKNLHILKMFALPAYFLVVNICTLLWACTYFNTPAYIAENKLTGYFTEKYGITEKETEIIGLTLKGLTYKQIAQELYISPKTVDNHVQSIYKKLKVTSKMQLSNLIRSKEK